MVTPRLLAVVRELRLSAQIGKRSTRTPAPGGGNSREFWRCDRWRPAAKRRYRSRADSPTRRMIALQTGGLVRDTHGAVADSRPQSPAAVASEGHYCPSSTSGGGVGDAPAGALLEKLPEYPFFGQRRFDLRAIASMAHRVAQAIRAIAFCIGGGVAAFLTGIPRRR